ncbi:hypothetical protein LQW54_000234 [Pestalotiopsis sp. IQ-011]
MRPSQLGANQGVDYETAKNLFVSPAEYDVILGSRDADKGEAAAKKLQSDPNTKGTVAMEQLNATDQQSIEDAARRIEFAHDRLDVLVKNVGIVSTTNPPTADALRRVLDTNIVGALSALGALLPLLR